MHIDLERVIGPVLSRLQRLTSTSAQEGTNAAVSGCYESPLVRRHSIPVSMVSQVPKCSVIALARNGSASLHERAQASSQVRASKVSQKTRSGSAR